MFAAEKDSLFALQITRELDSVSETAQRVHAVQHIWIQFSQGQYSSHTHSSGWRLLWTRLITTAPGTHTCKKSINNHFINKHLNSTIISETMDEPIV